MIVSTVNLGVTSCKYCHEPSLLWVTWNDAWRLYPPRVGPDPSTLYYDSDSPHFCKSYRIVKVKQKAKSRK
jgi:hypothetical protein